MIPFSETREPRVFLGGQRKKEDTTEETLVHAKAARALRLERRQQVQAALILQKHSRGFLTRKHVYESLVSTQCSNNEDMKELQASCDAFFLPRALLARRFHARAFWIRNAALYRTLLAHLLNVSSSSSDTHEETHLIQFTNKYQWIRTIELCCDERVLRRASEEGDGQLLLRAASRCALKISRLEFPEREKCRIQERETLEKGDLSSPERELIVRALLKAAAYCLWTVKDGALTDAFLLAALQASDDQLMPMYIKALKMIPGVAERLLEHPSLRNHVVEGLFVEKLFDEVSEERPPQGVGRRHAHADVLVLLDNLTILVAGQRKSKHGVPFYTSFLPVERAEQLLSRYLLAAEAMVHELPHCPREALPKCGHTFFLPCNDPNFTRRLVNLSSAQGSLSSSGDRGLLKPFVSFYTYVALSVPAAQRTKVLASLSLTRSTPTLLPALWKALAYGFYDVDDNGGPPWEGVPLSVHREASQGFYLHRFAKHILCDEEADCSSRKTLFLFLSMYEMHFQLIDDVEFVGSEPHDDTILTLGHHRALACTVNSIAFDHHCRHGSGNLLRNPLEDDDDGNAYGVLLPQHSILYGECVRAAFLVLRQLKRRDERLRFCSPKVWIEPYDKTFGGFTTDEQHSLHQGENSIAFLPSLTRMLLLSRSSSHHSHGAETRPSARTTRIKTAAGCIGSIGSIAKYVPHCIPLSIRVSLLRGFLEADKKARNLHLPPVQGGPRALSLRVRRTHVMEDAIAALLPASSATLKGPLRVEFISQHTGLPEPGIDMGGLTKEFLEAVASTGCIDGHRGLFLKAQDGSIYPNPVADRIPGGLETMEVLGTVFGKALYDGILLSTPPLAPFFASWLLGTCLGGWDRGHQAASFDDIRCMDADIYKSLTHIRRLAATQPDAVDDLCLDFTAESEAFGVRFSEELHPGGRSHPVTSANVHVYVVLLSHWHMNRIVASRAAAAFASGLFRVIEPQWLSLFSGPELRALLLGFVDLGEDESQSRLGGRRVDVEDLYRHTVYAGGYTAQSRTIRYFWEVLRSCTDEEVGLILTFATATARAPLGGFQHLEPPLTLYKVECEGSGNALLSRIGLGKDIERLPTASTCANMLKLPNYRTKKGLKEKLLYAARSGAGFDLS